MVACRVVTFQREAEGFVVELVRLTGVVAAEVDVYIVSFDRDLTEVGAANGNLTVVQFGVSNANLGGEIIGPVGIEGTSVSGQFCATLIEVVGEFQLIGVTVRLSDVEAIVPVIGEGCAVIIADVPVEFDKDLLVGIVSAGRDGARIIAIEFHGDVADFVDFSLRDVNFVDGARTDRSAVKQVHTFQLLVSSEEEQLVLDDRATNAKTVAVFIILTGRDVVAFERVCAQAIIGVVTEEVAVDFVRTGLRNSVDVTSGEAAILNIKRCQFDSNLLNSVVGERDTLGWVAVGVQAEIVVHANAVNGQ